MAEDDEEETLTEYDEEETPTDDEFLPLSKEESNLARISLLIKGIAPKAVREYFDGRFEPTKLTDLIHKNHDILYDLRLKRIITQCQWNLLFPSTGVPNSESFDITLMLCLLRNVMEVVEPRTGWDDKPLEADTNVGADLTRVKHYRNILAHYDSGEMDDTYFENVWEDLSNAIGRLGGENLEKECNSLKIKPLENMVNENIRDLIKKELKTWTLRNKNFIETGVAKCILKKALKFNFLTIVGNSGVGKTATLEHVSLIFQNEGYDIIPVTTCDEIIRYYNPYLPTVFVCDDFCGTCSLNQNRFRQWKDRIPKIKVILNSSKTKIIVTCRSQIYKDERIKKIDLFNLCVCNFSSTELRLTHSEKYEIAKKYTGHLAESVSLYSGNYDFFPLLCKLYSRNKSRAQLDSYFQNPFQAYKSELDMMLIEGGQKKYCALALCVVLNNFVVENNLITKLDQQLREIIDNVCEACRLKRGISAFELRDEMETLLGSYLRKENGVYSTIHDKLFDFMSNYFLNAMTECLVQNASSRFISQMIFFHKPEEYTDTLCSVVPTSFQPKLIRRIFDDWCKDRLEDVFLNINFDDPLFRSSFLNYFNQSLDLENQQILSNKSDEYGNTPLIQCCFIGDINLLERLLYHNVDVNKCRIDGVSPLFVACQEGHLKIATKLLDKHAKVNQTMSDGTTPLFIACQNDHLPIVQLLLRKRADVNKCTNIGSSPIIVSSELGYNRIVKCLLDAKARVDFKIMISDQEVSASTIAHLSGHYTIEKTLKEYDKPGVFEIIFLLVFAVFICIICSPIIVMFLLFLPITFFLFLVIMYVIPFLTNYIMYFFSFICCVFFSFIFCSIVFGTVYVMKKMHIDISPPLVPKLRP